MSGAEVAITNVGDDPWYDPGKWRWEVTKNGHYVCASVAITKFTARRWARFHARKADGIKFKPWWAASMALVEVALGVFFLCTHDLMGACAALVWFTLAAAVAVVIQRKERRRGYRQAEGDHQDQGASAGRIGSLLSGIGSGITWSGTIGTSTGVAELGEPLPERESDETITGYKLAHLKVFGGDLRFVGIGNGQTAPYGVESTAVCTTGYGFVGSGFSFSISHPRVGDYPKPCEHVPNPTHTCGFYAVAEPPSPGNYTVLLEVEMFGTVIAHEHGWRAEKQRVLSVRFPKVCASSLCGENATLAALVDERVVGLCDVHAADVERSPLNAPAPLAQIASLLGTEVRWAS